MERLLAASGGDDYVAVETTGHEIAAVDVRAGAYGWTTREWADGVDWTTVVGTDPDLIAACAAHLLDRAARRPTDGLTVSRVGTAATQARLGWVGDDRWGWWSTRTPPPTVPGEELVREVTADDPRLAALLAAWNPGRAVEPGDPVVARWVGIVDGDELVATAADTRQRPHVPYLAAVVTAGPYRGRGLAAALCAVLTRHALRDGAPLVTLATGSDNIAAHRVYERLGFAVRHHFSSGHLGGS